MFSSSIVKSRAVYQIAAILIILVASAGWVTARDSVQAGTLQQIGCLKPIVTKSGLISESQIWSSANIYRVNGNVTINPGITLTIEGGTTVKVSDDFSLDVQGTLDLQGGTGNEVTFTSVHDDNDGCDIDGDGNNILPQLGDWGSIKIRDVNNGVAITGLIVRYANEGLAALQVNPSETGPAITGNTFSNNNYGLALVVMNNGSSSAQIQGNAFTGNKYGFYVRRSASETGVAVPVLENNQFNSNTVLPIFLGHTAYPLYSNNSFQGYPAAEQRLGIGLGGIFTVSGSLPIINSAPDQAGLDMPYVVQHTNWTIASGVTVNVDAGTVIKVEYRSDMSGGVRVAPYRSITVYGTLVNPDLPAENIIITSIRDDSVAGDTNGDGVATEPLSDDWERVYFPDNNIHLSNIEFRYARFAVYSEDTSTGGYTTLSLAIENCTFSHNQTALYLKAADNSSSRIDTAMTANTFVYNTAFPIFLVNTSFASYTDNTFSMNNKPAIAIGGNIYKNGAWEAVPGEELPNLPYIIYGTVTVKGLTSTPVTDPAAEVTIRPDLVFKFYDTAPTDPNAEPSLCIDGNAIFESSAGHPIVFTSYKDDTRRGDTNFDGTASAPARNDWKMIRLRDSSTEFHDTIVNYSNYGITVENITNAALSPQIINNTFAHNTSGIYLVFRNNGDISSTIQGNVFSDNEYGLRTHADPTNSPTAIAAPALTTNTFTGNTGYPLYFNGATQPTYTNNVFSYNTHPAIAISGYWGHDAALILVSGDTNSPLNGDIFPYVVPDLSSSTSENVKIVSSIDLTIPQGTVIKLASDTFFDVYGKLVMESTSANPIIFTSYWDDTVKGDTGADGSARSPAAKDWRCVYIRSDDGSTSFHHAIVRYSQFGLRVVQESTFDISPLINENIFQSNYVGLSLLIKSDWDITSNIVGNQFTANTYGLVTTSDPATALRFGSANVTLDNNAFNGNTGFPIFLYHSADINYVKDGFNKETNTFQNHPHPAIGLNGYWPRDVTWWTVTGDNDQPFPYVVFKDNGIQAAYQNNYLVQGVSYMGAGFSPPQITIPAGTVVKFDANLGIYAWGKLNLLSDAANPIYLTSYKDDTVGGDTNGDGSATSPGLWDWKSVWLCDYPTKPNDIHDVVGRHAVAPIAVYYDGPTATSISPTIRDSTFEQNLSAILLAVGWYDENNDGIPEAPGNGHIYANLTNLLIRNSDYGLLTFAHPKSTGIVRPTLTNVTFQNIDEYPVFLGGTTQMEFADSQILMGPASLTPPDPMETPISLGIDERPDLPPEAYIMPKEEPAIESESTTTEPGLSLQALDPGQFNPAIAWGGSWNNAVTMPELPGIPYAVVGNYPVTLIINGKSYLPTDDVIIGATNATGSSVTLSQPGSVVKFNNNCLGNSNKKCKLIVWGNLVLMGTESNPIIFTSIHDDGVGGDTNGNGSATAPAKGQWDYIQLSGPNIDFKYALVRYAVEGVRVFFKGASNLNINPVIQHSSFYNNKTGVVLWSAGSGDIGKRPEPGIDPGTRMLIYHNTFMNNDNHIVIHRNESDTGSSPKPLVTGIVYANVLNNDLLEITNYGVDNNMEIPVGFAHPEYYTILAMDNYWSDPSGPHHSTNPSGLGVEVSDLVDFLSPPGWALTKFHQTVTYSINGRVVYSNPSDPNNPGLSGVTVHLGGASERTVTTDTQGYFQISGLELGTYYLIASKPGFSISPPLYGPFELQSDTQLTFYAEQVSPVARNLFFNQLIVETVQNVNGDRTVKLQVQLSQMPTGQTTFTYSTISATATSTNCPNRETCDYASVTNASATIEPLSVCVSPLTGQVIPYCKEISITVKPGDPTEPLEYFLVELTAITQNPDGAVILPEASQAMILINPKYDFFLFLPHIRK